MTKIDSMWLSPATDWISTIFSKESTIETSNVPPPKSNISNTLCSLSPLILRDKAAADGSLIHRSTLNPAIRPAFLVASLCSSLN